MFCNFVAIYNLERYIILYYEFYDDIFLQNSVMNFHRQNTYSQKDGKLYIRFKTYLYRNSFPILMSWTYCRYITHELRDTLYILQLILWRGGGDKLVLHQLLAFNAFVLSNTSLRCNNALTAVGERAIILQSVSAVVNMTSHYVTAQDLPRSGGDKVGWANKMHSFMTFYLSGIRVSLCQRCIFSDQFFTFKQILVWVWALYCSHIGQQIAHLKNLFPYQIFNAPTVWTHLELYPLNRCLPHIVTTSNAISSVFLTYFSILMNLHKQKSVI